LHKNINQVATSHDSKHNDLTLLLHTLMESKKPLGKSLQNIEGEMKTLNTTMNGYNKQITDIEYGQKDHQNRLRGIEDAQKSKKDHNTKIIVELITATDGLGGSALGLAHYFYERGVVRLDG